MGAIETTAISRNRPADFIPGYRLERLVGRGGMGEVHRAVQISLGRTVAVKLLATELARDDSFVARFEKEGAALATLSHPNIVSIVDRGKNDSTYYLVMEFVDGPSMREQMRSPLLDTHSALRMMLEVCRGIEYAHTRGVIHRDLKPENILFSEQAGGIAKVTDFGLAGFMEDSAAAPNFHVTQTHVAMGTHAYMAPEQRVDAKSADHRADIYSLGVILYELLVGALPIGSYDPPSTRKADLDKRLDGIVAKCLKPLPQDRYQKVAELIADLEPLVPTTHAPLAGTLTRAQRLKRTATQVLRKVGSVAAVALVLGAVVVLGAALVQDRQRSPLEEEVGVMLTTETGKRWPFTSQGRAHFGDTAHSVTLGEGPDAISLVSVGRKADIDSGKVGFAPSDDEGPAGRLLVDANLEGHSITVSAVAHIQRLAPGRLTALRSALLGPAPHPQAALMLLGTDGRYVALILPASESPPYLEWGLGTERRGTMSSPISITQEHTRLELTVEPTTGELFAYVGGEEDKRLVGDPLSLGPGWQKLFGQMPKGAVGCVHGTCTFQSLEVQVGLPSPLPEPIAVAPPPPPDPVATPTKTKPKAKVSAPPAKKSNKARPISAATKKRGSGTRKR